MPTPELPPGAESRLRRLLSREWYMEVGRLAVRRGFITEAQLKEALWAGRPLPAVLSERGWVGAQEWEALESLWRQEAFDLATLARSHPAPPEALPHLGDPARNLAEFVLVSRLGRGGAGEVWKAWDQRLGRWVALKRPSSPPDSRADWERFHREAAAVARLAHPNIVPVYRVSGPDESPFIAMQYIEGRTLEGVRLPLRDALETARAAALAVDHAHRKGVLHRDLKPGNLMRDRQGTVWVLDFGLACLLETRDRITATGAVAGTPEYMSPEQARGDPAARTAATDIYGLGATLYALLTGAPPYAGGSVVEIVNKIETSEPVPIRRLDPMIPADAATVVAKAMDKDPVRRYPEAAALAEDLRRLLAGEPVLARPETVARRLWRRALRHRAAAIPVLAAVLAALAASAAALIGYRGRLRETLREARLREEAARSGEMRAMALLESVRPAIEKATAALYARDADYEPHRRGLSNALALIEEAARQAPQLPLAYHRLGETLELLGRYARAEEAWRTAAALDPRLGPARYRLGRILVVRAYLDSLNLWHDQRNGAGGEPSAVEAIREMEAAQEAGSGFDNDLQRQVASAMLAWIRRDRQIAREICLPALDRFGDSPGVEEFHWLLGLAAERPRDSLPHFDAAIALRPKFPLALYSRADARARLKDHDGAVADYDEAIRIVPEFAEAHIYRATVFYQKRDAAAALEAFTRAIARGFLLPAAYNGRGWTRVELLGDLDGGIEDLSEAIRLMPYGYGLPYAGRAAAYFKKGAWAQAAADCTKALALMPDWDNLRRTRARCRAQLGDLEGAAEDLKAAGAGPGDEPPKPVEEPRRWPER